MSARVYFMKRVKDCKDVYKRQNKNIEVYKQLKLGCLHCSSCIDIIDPFFTVFYTFHKINSSRHNDIMALEIRYYKANS